jgi:fumarate hydratase class II
MNCCRAGQLELNATLPLIAYCLHESIACLANGARVFAEKCIRAIEANSARCEELMERSVMTVAALNPLIGYDLGASVAKEALDTGRSIRDVILSRGIIDPQTLDQSLDPRALAHGHIDSTAAKAPGVERWETEGGHLVKPTGSR